MADWRYVNEDEGAVTVHAGDDGVSRSFAEGSPGYYDNVEATSFFPPPGERVELTLVAVPDARMQVNLTMPAGGTIHDVDRDTGNATLTGFERFDRWTGAQVRFVPGAFRFQEASTQQDPMVAMGNLGSFFPGMAARYQVGTPEGCHGSSTVASHSFGGPEDSSFDCPAGTPEPIMDFSHEQFYYRGEVAGQFEFNGTLASGDGGAATFFATATFPEDGTG